MKNLQRWKRTNLYGLC